MLDKLDLYLLDRVFQRIADYLHNLTSKNNFWYCKIFYLLTVSIGAIGAGFEFLTGDRSWVDGVVFAILLIAVTTWQGFGEDEARAVAKGFLNPQRENTLDRIIRLFCCAIFLKTLWGLFEEPGIKSQIWFLAYLFFLLAVYFQACTPKPPRPKEITKLVPTLI